MRLDLKLSGALIGTLYLLSYPILLYGRIFSGPLTASVLTAAACLLTLYIGLGMRETELALQVVFFVIGFAGFALYFQRLGKTLRDQDILKEKLSEEINLSQKEMLRVYARKKALEEKIGRLLDLEHFSAALKGMTDAEQVSAAVLERLGALLPKADECALYLVDPAKHELGLVHGKRSDGGQVRSKNGSVFDRWAMKKSQSLVVDDAENDFRFSYQDASDIPHPRSLCVSPLVTENRVLGVVRVSAAAPCVFSAEDLRLVDIYASLAAVTLRNILLYERMEELAVRDSLTGLYLNRYFQGCLAEETRRASLNPKPFSLIMIDIDHFKRFNDEYGHAAGDLVLRATASVLARSIEPTDIVARYGGEEFVILLPGKGRDEALRTAETIRKAIESHMFLLRRHEVHATVSLGLAVFPEDGRSKEELIWAADKRLYQAKASGRNRTVAV